MDSLFDLHNALSYCNGTLHRLDKQTPRDAPASWKVKTEYQSKNDTTYPVMSNFVFQTNDIRVS